METVSHKVEFCVIGGGLAGMCAAISAARKGVKTLLMHERPVLGGNASSEIRMWICGTNHLVETGIIEELRLENLCRNTNFNYSVWDTILFEKVRFQENLTSLLNCSCFDAETRDGRIVSVTGWQMTTQKFHRVEADFFADCSGDSILAPLSGADFRIGREAKDEFNESLGQDKSDNKTMGLSCLMQARETTSPKKFTPPAWAKHFTDDSVLAHRDHTINEYQNFWWIELGGDQDSIGDTEEIRDELLKTAYGIWDHIKNQGDHGAENWELDWIGFLPGKRESRRYIGDYILCENDVLTGGKFHDTIAFGGWPVDDHHPGGIKHYGSPNIVIHPEQPYGIPLRSLYSRNISNLWFAGRNISATHTALSSSRVMATCATLGQAVGCAVTAAVKHQVKTARETAEKYTGEIQTYLLDEDCYLPGFTREVSPICRKAKLSASSGDPEMLRNGKDHNLNGSDNYWHCRPGDTAQYDFGREIELKNVRLVFDSNLHRVSRNTVTNYWLNGKKFEVPETIADSFEIIADGKVIYKTTDNCQRLVNIPINIKASTITLKVISFAGKKDSGQVCAFDVQQ